MCQKLVLIVGQVVSVEWKRPIFEFEKPWNALLCALKAVLDVLLNDSPVYNPRLDIYRTQQLDWWFAHLMRCSRWPWPNSAKCLFTSFFMCSARAVWTVLQRMRRQARGKELAIPWSRRRWKSFVRQTDSCRGVHEYEPCEKKVIRNRH